MKYNWNPYTADEPDDSSYLRDAEIERRANCLMDDEDWVACQFEDGLVSGQGLFKTIAGPYVHGSTHALIGGLIIDVLWKLAMQQATDTIDDSDYDGE